MSGMVECSRHGGRDGSRDGAAGGSGGVLVDLVLTVDRAGGATGGALTGGGRTAEVDVGCCFKLTGAAL